MFNSHVENMNYNLSPNEMETNGEWAKSDILENRHLKSFRLWLLQPGEYTWHRAKDE